MLPSGFCYLKDVDESIITEIRYAGCHNFAGRPLPGYKTAQCVMTTAAAESLAAAQKIALKRNLTLKVYDAYRPQKAVDAIIAWCNDPNDLLMKEEFYPRLSKSRIMPEGYLSPTSTHAYGSTVDLTLVPMPVPRQDTYRPGDPLKDATLPKGQRFDDNSIEMGTGYDAFDPRANTLHPAISEEARTNRLLLKGLMERHGFLSYSQEWWHFTLEAAPFAKPFDFDIE